MTDTIPAPEHDERCRHTDCVGECCEPCANMPKADRCKHGKLMDSNDDICGTCEELDMEGRQVKSTLLLFALFLVPAFIPRCASGAEPVTPSLVCQVQHALKLHVTRAPRHIGGCGQRVGHARSLARTREPWHL